MENKIIFTNNPIDSISLDDFIGIEPYVDSIEEVLEKSSILALTGDFSSGKSSIINALERKIKTDKVKFKKITLLHYINKPNNSIPDSADLLKIMMQSFTDENPRLKSFVNKKMSSYGELSFVKLNSIEYIYIIYFIFFSFFVYFSSFIYLNFNNIEIINSNSIFSYFMPIFYIFSKVENFIPHIFVATLLYTIAKSEIVFSLWDSQAIRKVSEEEIIDLFYTIINKDLSANQNIEKIILIIEDADRIENFAVISDFLKLIYRISQLRINGERKINFIIPIRDEFLINEENDKEIFPKIFDVIINIKKIHSFDYKAVIIKMLNSKKDTDEFKEIFETEITDFPYQVGKILDGEKLSLRKIKNRLNSTFQIYRNLRNLDVIMPIKLESCSYIAYLECEYPNAFHMFVQDEKTYNNVFQKYSIGVEFNENDFNSLSIDISKLSDELKIKHAKKVNDEIAQFAKDMILIQTTREFDNNMRMYFFRYPKDTYILTEHEITLMKSLSLNEVDLELTSSIERVFRIESQIDNIVKHIKLIMSFGEFPSELVFKYDQLINISLDIDYQLYSAQIINFFKSKDLDLKYICERLISFYNLKSDYSDIFLFDFSKMIINNSLNFKENTILSNYRYLIREVLYKSKEIANLLYNDERIIVTETELKSFSQENTIFAVESIVISKIDSICIDYITDFLLSYASIKDKKKIHDLLTDIFKKGLNLDQEKYLSFLIKFEIFDTEFQRNIHKDIIVKNYLSNLLVYSKLIIQNGIQIDLSILSLLAKVYIDKDLALALFQDFYRNNLYEKVVELIPSYANKVNFDLSNESIALVINSYLNSGKCNIDILINFRLFLIRNYEEHLNLYKDLFTSKYPRLNDEEIKGIKNLGTINEYLKFDYIDSELYESIIDRINKCKAFDEDYEKFIYNISNFRIRIDSSFLNILLLKVEFKRFGLKHRDQNLISVFFDILYSHFQKANIVDRFSIMLEYGLIDNRELKKLENQILPSELITLFEKLMLNNTFNQLDFHTLENIFLDSILNEKVQKLLSDKNNINSYSSKILKDVSETRTINIDILLKLFRNTKVTRNKLLNSPDFILAISKMGLLKECKSNEFYEIAKLTQNFELIVYIFDTIVEDKEISIYISEVMSIVKEEERKIVDFLVKEKNLSRLNVSSINSFKKLLSRGQKGKISSHLKKYAK